MRKIPEANAAVPFIFWGREKKAIVFCRPIINVKPIRKRICIYVYSVSYFGLPFLLLTFNSYISHSEPNKENQNPLASLLQLRSTLPPPASLLKYKTDTYNDRSKNIRTPPNKNSPPENSINIHFFPSTSENDLNNGWRDQGFIPPEQKMTPSSINNETLMLAIRSSEIFI